MEYFADIASFWKIAVAIYAGTACLSYLIFALMAGVALQQHERVSETGNLNGVLSSTFAPKVTVIAPAFNESMSIVENIRGLLTLKYNKLEIVIVNDGSKDDTLQKAIREFNLEKVYYPFDYEIDCKPIRGIYKSRNKALEKLIVVDKENGGKADALNAGVNVCRSDLFMAMDVDSLIDREAVLKLIRPFLKETSKKVIAVGAVVRVANSCRIAGGNVSKVHVPRNLWARFQALEYIRAFLIGRMAWKKIDGLLLISGAIGMFDIPTVKKCGGYLKSTVGEDMELLVRMRRYMCEKKRPYIVDFVPDPLCWTEVPESLKTLGRQRNRWMRGTMDTLRLHKRMFLNPKYKAVGTLGYPYWMFFEWLAPIFEFTGIIFFIALAFTGQIQWNYALILLAFVYMFAVTISSWAILLEAFTFHKYDKPSHIGSLLFTALIEPLIYHPLTVWWGIRGNIDYLRGVSSWGAQERKGFSKKKTIK
ncbi:glycosyltransferase family 2 protein [Marinilabilia rubra]|uniref:Glycosyl transferase family 2 n=1 Tax=Marinilabilia rubra TaxID=2162893 RepID=A0A2U2BD20_9BACT|nr:glycosyltransferase [Marinilabilia rubra]PWE00964.1 glycosyl transferase family 2 [Marinilabilia rubra]